MNQLQYISATISALSDKEMKECLLYIQAHSTSAQSIKIFKCIQSLKVKTSKEDIHKALYGDTTYSDTNIRKALSTFRPLLDVYILDKANNIDSKKIKAIRSIKASHSAEVYRQLKKSFSSDELMELQTDTGIEWRLLNALDSMEEIEQRNVRTAEPNLQAVLDALDDRYLLDKLKIACSALNFSQINQHTYQLGILDHLEAYFTTANDISKPFIYLYYHTYSFLKNNENEPFEIVFEYLQSKPIYRSDEYIHIFTMCINYCIRSINNGKREYLPTLFHLYQRQIESGCVYDIYGYISPHTFKNTLNLALNLKEYEWANHFIESNNEKLPIAHREEDYLFAKARLSFEQKQYKASVRYILQSKATDPLNNLSMRVLQVKANYLLDDYDAVDATIQNAKLYLLRMKSKAYQISLYKNFFSVMDKIINTGLKNTNRIDNFLKTINEKPIAEKSWLMKILGDIKTL